MFYTNYTLTRPKLVICSLHKFLPVLSVLPAIVMPLRLLWIIAFCLSVQSQKDPATIDKIMKDLDTNGDGEVNFEEFVSLVAGLSIACEQCYQAHLKSKK